MCRSAMTNYSKNKPKPKSSWKREKKKTYRQDFVHNMERFEMSGFG
jgi:hypothetical protein